MKLARPKGTAASRDPGLLDQRIFCAIVVIRKGDLDRADEKAKGPLNGSPLDGILADMLRSALTWEQDHGQPPLCGYEKTKTLTGIRSWVYNGRTGKHRGGEHHDDGNDQERHESPIDLRESEGPSG